MPLAITGSTAAGRGRPAVLAAAAAEVVAAFRRMRDDIDPLIYSHDPR